MAKQQRPPIITRRICVACGPQANVRGPFLTEARPEPCRRCGGGLLGLADPREQPWTLPYEPTIQHGVLIVWSPNDRIARDHLLVYLADEAGTVWLDTRTACGRPDPGPAWMAPRPGDQCRRCFEGVGPAFRDLEGSVAGQCLGVLQVLGQR